MEKRDDYIAALLREREACEAQGLTERVAAINKELRAVGANAELRRRKPERRPHPVTIDGLERR
jgi:hypothetical protein